MLLLMGPKPALLFDLRLTTTAAFSVASVVPPASVGPARAGAR